MRRATLRKLPPETRKVARLIADLESVARRLKNFLPRLAALEEAEKAELAREAFEREKETYPRLKEEV